MEWIIMAAGLLLLFGLLCKTRRPQMSFVPSVRFDGAMESTIKEAAQEKDNSKIHFAVSKRLLSDIENALLRLSAFPEETWLPSTRKLCENGRFLQEEAAGVLMQSKGIRRLTKESGVCLFAYTLVRCASSPLDAAILRSAISAWQDVIPMTNAEFSMLPYALRHALVEWLLSCTSACVNEQVEANAGEKPTETAENDQEHQIETALIVSTAIRSLHSLHTIPWNSLIEELSFIHQTYKNDPVYAGMNENSRKQYRSRTAQIARRTKQSEQTVCEAVLSLCAGAESIEAHVGYYLLDEGYPRLLASLQAGSKNRISKKQAFLPGMTLQQLSDEHRVLAVCPATLKDTQQAVRIVKQLQIMHEANPDPKLHFLLLGDFQDSLSGTLSTDAEIMNAASSAVEALSETSGHPFFYIQRERIQLPGERHYHCRNHYQGAVDTCLRLMEGMGTEDVFAFSTVEPSSLKGLYRYMLVVDEGMILPSNSIYEMVGTMLHPLNQRMEHNGSLRGISVLCPQVDIAPHLVKTCFARWFGISKGNTPFSLQGLYDPAAFLANTHRRQNRFEQPEFFYRSRSGCDISNRIVWYGGTPAHLNERLHILYQNTCKSWQLLPFLLSATKTEKRIRSEGWRRLLTTLVNPTCMFLLFYTVLFSIPLIPFVVLLFAFRFSSVVLLPCSAVVQSEAIFRTLYTLFTHRQPKTLRPDQWNLPVYVSVQLGSAAALGILSLMIMPAGWLPLALAVTWLLFAIFLPYLEREVNHTHKPTEYMRDVLIRLARHTLLFFETTISEIDHALPPKRVQIDPNKGILHQTSPDEIGLYLCALIACEKMTLISTQEMAQRIEKTVTTLEKLEKWHGLLFECYDTQTLKTIQPNSISSLSSGLLAVCLLTCAQGLRMKTHVLPETFSDLSGRIDALAYAMELYRLYDEDVGLFYTAVSLPDEQFSETHHKLLASESRLLSFAAIAMGQIPQKHWKNLNRIENRERVLLSQHGTMEEYLLPVLFLPLIPGTLLSRSSCHAFKMQRRHQLGRAFGLGECEIYSFDPELNYLNQISGIPELALDSSVENDSQSPCASMLALANQPYICFRNLQRMQMLGLEGPLGLFEAADFNQQRTHGKPFRVVRSHTANHQAMVLCAICNALCDQYVANLFSSLSCVQAHRLLLEEKPSSVRNPVRRPLRLLLPKQMQHQSAMKREAHSLHFPVDAHLLSGGGTSLLVDAQGGGSLRHADVQLTRFKNSCRISSGARFYLRDSQSGAYWVITDPHMQGTVSFESSQAVFSHIRFDIVCEMRIWINPLDGTVVHLLTLRNESGTERMMEVCSFLEPDLTLSEKDDSRLQIRTERLTKQGASALRQTQNRKLLLQHLCVSSCHFSVFRIQTDQTAFLGRGRSFHAPRALDMPISAVADSIGDFIEPCLSLRGQFMLPSGAEHRFLFLTHLAQSDENADAFTQRYTREETIMQTAETALIRSQVTSRFLKTNEEEQVLISRLTGAMYYTEQPFQANTVVLRKLPLKILPEYGDPVLAVSCTEHFKTEVIHTLFKAHSFWRMSGFLTNIVFEIPNASVQENILMMIKEEGLSHLLDASGGFFILRNDDEDRRILLHTLARLRLDASIPLDVQMDTMVSLVSARPIYRCLPTSEWKPSLPPSDPVVMDNGFGGFTRTDGDYRILLAPGVQTPAPWLHPLQGKTLRTMTCESGLMETYKADLPITHGGETFFLRDSAHHLLWSPTRQPLGHGMPVRITYAPGETGYESSAYGIYTKLLCFTDVDYDFSLRIITVKNTDDVPRTVQLFHSCIFHPLAQAQCASAHIRMHLPEYEGVVGLCAVDPSRCSAISSSGGAFQGLWSRAPFQLSTQETLADSGGNVGLLSFVMHLDPGESCTLTTTIGWAEDSETFDRQLEQLRREGAGKRLTKVRQSWAEKAGKLRFDLPDQTLSLMLTRWLPYQIQLSTQMNGGSQDLLSLLIAEPRDARKQLEEKPESLEEQLLQALAAAHYAETTGEMLDEALIARCMEILQSIPLGAHNLPLISENGESVWLGMLLCEVLRHFDMPDHQKRREELLHSIERFAWDGGWYLRGWADDGSKLGSASSAECRVDGCTQSWAVLCGASRDRCALAIENAWRMLFEPDTGLFKCFAPPYMHHKLLPGMGANGGHRTKDACWFIAALHQTGQEERAWQLALAILPCRLSATRQLTMRYHGEPYALAADISSNPHQRGRCISTWETDAARIYWKTIVQQLLGLKITGQELRFRPVAPPDWDEVRITYQYGTATYHLHARRDCAQAISEGEILPSGILMLCNDGKIHEATFPLR